MNDIDRRLHDLNPVRTEDLASAGRTPEARALLSRILSAPASTESGLGPSHRSLRRRRAWLAALVAAAAVAAAISLGTWPPGSSRTHERTSPTTGPGPQLQVVRFTREGGNVVARITDPLAAADQLTAVFHEHGLDIRVKALPVSPSLVGTIVFSDIDVIRSLHAGRCLTGGGTSCPVGLVIPADFAGEGNVVVGRAARSGETYGSSADAFGNGEALHCSGILGRPAADAIPILRKKGLTPQWMTGGQRTGPNPPDGYVVGGVPLSSTAVLLDTVPEPLATPEFRHYEALANRGC